MVTARDLIEPLSESRQHTGFFQRGHSQKNAQEEENRGHVDLVQDRRHALFGGAVAVLFRAIEHFGDRPEQAEHQEDAHVGGEFGKVVEDGHKEQSAHTEEENQSTFGARELMGVSLCLIHYLFGVAERAVQMILQ